MLGGGRLTSSFVDLKLLYGKLYTKFMFLSFVKSPKFLYISLTLLLLLVTTSVLAFSTIKSITGQIIAVITSKPYEISFSGTNLNIEVNDNGSKLRVYNISRDYESLLLNRPWTMFVANVSFINHQEKSINPYVKSLIMSRTSLKNEIFMATAYLWDDCQKSVDYIINLAYDRNLTISSGNKKFCVTHFIICNPSDAACATWDNSNYSLGKDKNTSYFIFILFPNVIENNIYNLKINAGIE